MSVFLAGAVCGAALALLAGGAWLWNWMRRHDIVEMRRREQLRRDFVANVSHELRTPLTSIKGFAEVLRMGALEDTERRLEFVETIEAHADRLTRLVDDLLAISSLDSGVSEPEREPLSLIKAVAEATAGLKPQAQRKQIVIRIEPFHDIPQVFADRHQLKQVLTNLVDNAIKFTPERGTIRITAAVSGNRVTVAIADNGIGIPAEDLPRIFERFYRVDKARSREVGGTGLGLSIVKHSVEAHGGQVGVESSPGGGTTFRFSLPVA